MFFSPFRLSTVQFLFNVFLQKKKRETQKNKCFLWMGKIREYNFLAGAAFFFSDFCVGEKTKSKKTILLYNYFYQDEILRLRKQSQKFSKIYTIQKMVSW